MVIFNIVNTRISAVPLKWLNIFYQLYYQDTPPPYWDAYIGEEYVWIYKTE